MRDRNATHGEPEDNFQNIADFWNVWTGMKFKAHPQGTPLNMNKFFSATDVAILMDLMKTSRLITSPDVADHWIDKCGYSACGGGIATKEEGK